MKFKILLILLLIMPMVNAAMLMNETFEAATLNSTYVWRSLDGGIMSLNTTNPLNGLKSGSGSTNSAWGYSWGNFSSTTTSNVTISFKWKLGNGNAGFIFGEVPPTSGWYYVDGWSFTCGYATAGDDKLGFTDGTSYFGLNHSCNTTSSLNITIMVANIGTAGAYANISVNGSGSNVTSITFYDMPNNLGHIGLEQFLNTDNSLIDDICVCEGNWNTTCCNGPAGGTGTGIATNFTSPTPPDGDATNYNVTINVTCNVTSTNTTYKIWFEYNDTTPDNLVLNSTISGNWTTNASLEGTYTYIGGCEINGTIGENTTSRAWILSLTIPNITILPGNEFNTTSYALTYNYSYGNSPFDKNFTINLTLRDSIGLYAYEILIGNSTANYVNVSNTSSLAGATEYNISRGFNSSNWSNNIYCANISVSDSHTTTTIKEYQVTSTKDTLTMNTAEGNTISITATEANTASTTKTTDRYNFQFEYPETASKDKTYIVKSLKGGKVDYLPSSKYKAHFVIFNNFKEGGNWVDFEGNEGNPIVTKINDQEYQVTFKNLETKEVTFNSIGGLNIINSVYCVWEANNYTINALNGLSGSYTYANLSYQMDGVNNCATEFNLYHPSDFEVTLEGNTTGVNHTDSGWCVGGGLPTEQRIYSNFTLPNTSGVYSLNFSIKIQFNDGVTWPEAWWTIPYNITAYGWNATNCTGNSSIENVTITILFYDEEQPSTQLIENWSVELVIWANETWNNKTYNFNFTNKNNYSICLGSNITLGSNAYTTYKNNTNGYTNKYIWLNQTINSSTWNISAYGLQRNNLSTLRITNRNKADYTYFDNSLAHLERRYLSEGIWRIVQTDLSDAYGLMIFYVEENSVDYRIAFYDNYGRWIKNSTYLKFSCTSGLCELTSFLEIYDEGTGDDNLKWVYNYTNTTGAVNISWNDTSEVVQNLSFYVAKRTITGDSVICWQNFSAAAHSGTMGCDISAYTGTIMVKLYKTASPTKPTFVEWINRLAAGLSQSLQAEGVFWALILMVAIVLIGMIHPIAAIFMTITGLIVLMAIGMVGAITLTLVIVAGVMGTAIALKIRR